jgi:hypothetical protein
VVQRLRNKLSFANVMAVIAVFIVIGGTAYAGSKISGKKLKNNSVAGKKLKTNSVTANKLNCPAGAPTRTGALCYGPLQTPTNWINAVQTGCPSQGLRLPTNGEALLVVKAAGGETWTDDVITPSIAGEAGRVEGGTVFSTPLATSHGYRCVTTAG